MDCLSIIHKRIVCTLCTTINWTMFVFACTKRCRCECELLIQFYRMNDRRYIAWEHDDGLDAIVNSFPRIDDDYTITIGITRAAIWRLPSQQPNNIFGIYSMQFCCLFVDDDSLFSRFFSTISLPTIYWRFIFHRPLIVVTVYGKLFCNSLIRFVVGKNTNTHHTHWTLKLLIIWLVSHTEIATKGTTSAKAREKSVFVCRRDRLRVQEHEHR